MLISDIGGSQKQSNLIYLNNKPVIRKLIIKANKSFGSILLEYSINIQTNFDLNLFYVYKRIMDFIIILIQWAQYIVLSFPI